MVIEHVYVGPELPLEPTYMSVVEGTSACDTYYYSQNVSIEKRVLLIHPPGHPLIRHLKSDYYII